MKTTKPNSLLNLDKVEVYTTEYTDKDGSRHHAMLGRFPGNGDLKWFVIPGTVDKLTKTPAKWLVTLLESAREHLGDESSYRGAIVAAPDPDGIQSV